MAKIVLITKAGTRGKASAITSKHIRMVTITIDGINWVIQNESVVRAINMFTERKNQLIVMNTTSNRKVVTVNFDEAPGMTIMISVISPAGVAMKEVTLTPEGITQLVGVLNSVKEFPDA